MRNTYTYILHTWYPHVLLYIINIIYIYKLFYFINQAKIRVDTGGTFYIIKIKIKRIVHKDDFLRGSTQVPHMHVYR